ncbi:MAG TPA: 30S ribosomal protein S1 [Candidatus Acidoferrales bacterium]|nr:30S ribosomal protein S1 [Candidatus Acidoferrales bacterium]
MAVDENNEQLEPGVPENYEDLLEDYSHFAPPSADQVLQGTVLGVTAKDVIIDFGYKSEGIVPLEQFQSPSGEVTVQRGDVVDVMIDHSGEPVEGYVLLSHTRAARLKIWDHLEKSQQDGLVLSGRVLGRVKGGLAVDVGVKAFMPGSQADPRPIHNLDSLVGQDIPVKIIKLNRRRGNVVVSRKVAIEEEIHVRKSATLEHLSEGAVVTGVVKNLTEYGAFIDLGGIDGLLHVTDMSYGRIQHPNELLQVGQELTVKVLKFDRGKERVSLGLKQLEPDPWEAVTERYPLNARVIGRVVNVTDYGAFIELEPGVEGLIHISEMTWSRRMKHPSKVVKTGDQVEAVVLEVHPRERRISLGLKQLEPNPWTTIDSRYSVGSVVEGRVRNMTDFGAFIEIEEGIDGLVHVSDLSWTKRIKHPNEVLKKGMMVQAVILNIDSSAHRLSLGIKQLQPDAWETYFQNHQVGDTVHGKVCRLASFGAFVELAEGVEGLCHWSEVPGYSGRRGSEEPPIHVGEAHDFKVIKMSEAEKKIGLSLRAVSDDDEKNRLEDYQRQAAAATTTIEEVMSLKDRQHE